MTQTTTSNSQAPPSAGFLFICVNKFDTITPLQYYLSHGAQHGAARIGDNKMEQVMKMAIEAYCEISGYSFDYVASQCATNFDGPVCQTVIMMAIAAK